jgi:CHASE1-domain containing sensor protein/tRNA A-37 threonylcarbamoyl transferase component Bud32
MRRRWWWLPIGVAVVGTVLTIVAARISVERTRIARGQVLDQAAEQLSFAVIERVSLPAEALQTLGAFIAHAPSVDRPTFDAVAASVHARTPRIYALEWAPRIRGDERAALEARARTEVTPDWTVREPADNGLTTALPRDEYMPILYAFPINPAFGFDVLSRRESREMVQECCRAGHAMFSPRYRLVEDAENAASVILYEPVWHGARIPADPAARCRELDGIAILIFRVGAVVGEAIDRSGHAGLDVNLEDVSTGGPADTLYEHRAGGVPRANRAQHRDAAIEMYGRTWRLRVAYVDEPAWPFAEMAIGSGLTAVAAVLAGVAAWLLANRRRLLAMNRLGQYKVEREIGRGAMGVVYRAQHQLLRRPAALKLLAPDLVDAASRARFEREVRLAAKLQHPSVVQVYDFGVTAEGLFFYAMELLDGVTIAELVGRGPMPVARTIAIVRQVAEALREAHGKRIVHRDLAPSNLMLTVRGETYDVVKVLDFGLVKRIRTVAGDEDHAPLSSEAGLVIGTPGFIAPEVLRGKDADERVDIYALGAVWYAMLAGRPPYAAASPELTMKAQLRAAPVPLHKLDPELPMAVVELVTECMQADPRLRLRSMSELVQRLDALAVPPWTQELARRWWKERRT